MQPPFLSNPGSYFVSKGGIFLSEKNEDSDKYLCSCAYYGQNLDCFCRVGAKKQQKQHNKQTNLSQVDFGTTLKASSF